MSAWWTATRNISKSIITQPCQTETRHSLTGPLIYLHRMVIKTRQTDPVRARRGLLDVFSMSYFSAPSKPGLKLVVFGFALFVLLVPGCKPSEIQTLLGPSQALISVAAEEAASLVGAKKQVALITHDSSWGPPSSAEEALQHALKKLGLTVVTVKSASLGNPMLSGMIGLKAADFLEALQKSTGSGVVLSLVGAPQFTPYEIARVPAEHPPVLIIATAMLGDKMGVRGDPLQLASLLEAQVIQLAIIDGADPAPNTSGKQDSAREVFAHHYHILRKPR